MKSLIFKNVNGNLNVEFKVDMLGSNEGNITVMDVVGLDDAEEVLGINFPKQSTDFTTLKTFAEDNNLILTEITNADAPTTHVALGTPLAVVTVNGDLGAGVAADAEVTDVTCSADVADSLDGKYFTFSSPTVNYYAWYNTSGGGAVDPALANKTGVEIAITTGDTANAVATATRAAIDALAAFVVTGATNHAIITNAVKGASTNWAAGDSGFTASVTNEGTTGVAYSEALEAEGGNGTYTWALADGSDPLPTGLTISSLGVISGTPTVAGTFAFDVEVEDGFGVTAQETLEIVVAS